MKKLEILDVTRDLTSTQAKIYMTLLITFGNQVFDAGVEELAEEFGCCISTIYQSFQKLEKVGLIKRVDRDLKTSYWRVIGNYVR